MRLQSGAVWQPASSMHLSRPTDKGQDISFISFDMEYIHCYEYHRTTGNNIIDTIEIIALKYRIRNE